MAMSLAPRRALALLLPVLLAACGPAPLPPLPPPRVAPLVKKPAPPPPPVVETKAPERPRPPAPASPPALALPAMVTAELPNGVASVVAAMPGETLADVRVVAPRGAAYAREKPAVAALWPSLLEGAGAGELPAREVAARLDAMGATLAIDVGLDRTEISISVPSAEVPAAIGLLGSLVTRPGLDAAALGRAKASLDASAPKAAGLAAEALLRDLFASPAGHHPYAVQASTAAERAAVGVVDVRAFHEHVFAPKGVVVVVAGDVAADVTGAAIERAFGPLRGEAPPEYALPEPAPRKGPRVTLLDRPGQPRSEIAVGALGPSASSEDLVAFQACAKLVGLRLGPIGYPPAPAGPERAFVLTLARAPSMLVVRGAAPAQGTTAAVKEILSALSTLLRAPPPQGDVEDAARALIGHRATLLGLPGGVTSTVASQRVLGLPEGALGAWRTSLLAVGPEAVTRAAATHLDPARLGVVVVGDAATLGPELAAFGEVQVVDPAAGFQVVRTLPRAADSAPPSP
jgi:predicted Zn-dependent peptidase